MIRALAVSIVLASAVSASAFAQSSPDAVASSSAFSVTTKEIARSYGDVAPRDDPKTVLATLRAVCDSKRREDKRRCAAGTRALNAGYRKLLEKRAAAQPG